MSREDRLRRKAARRLARRGALSPRSHSSDATPPSDPRTPLWAPSGVDLEGVPAEVRQAIAQVIQPAYEQFVLNTADGMERWIGDTLVHLLWLELLHQFDLKRDYILFAAVPELSRTPQSEITYHLRLIESKMKIGGFLLRLRETRERLGDQGHWPVAVSAPAPLKTLTTPPVVGPEDPSTGTPKLEAANSVDQNQSHLPREDER